MKKKIITGVIIVICIIISIAFCLVSISQSEQEFDQINDDTVEEILFQIQPRQKELVARLSVMGGSSVVLSYNHELDIILDRGKLYDKSNMQLWEEGDKYACHANCMELLVNDYSLKFITGYALADNQWEWHVWLVNGSTIIETTYPRIKYFGAELTVNEVIDFGLYMRFLGVQKELI